MAKLKQQPKIPVYKVKPFKAGRVRVKLGKLPSFKVKSIKI